MAYSGYDYFTEEANSEAEHQCLVCNTACHASRNVFGPTSFATAIGKMSSHHDRFVCPHADKPWHAQALQLTISIDKTPSKRLAELMIADRDDLLREHLRGVAAAND